MNSRFYIKISPKFKFNKISLIKQTGFNSDTSLKKILYHFDDKSVIKGNNSELKKNKNNENIKIKLYSQYKNELNQLINNKYTNSLTSISNDRKIRDLGSLRTKLLQNNNRLKNIDFNVNPDIDKDYELKLNINHYLSQRKINNKILGYKGSQNRIKNFYSEDIKNNYDIGLNNKMFDLKINKSHHSNKTNKLYLPNISTNIIRKSNNMRSLIKMIDFNNYNGLEKNDPDKKITTYNGKKTERDIFKNINYFIDNKKSTLNVNDIRRNISNISNNDDIEKNFFNKKKSSFNKDQGTINKNDNEKNNEEDIINNKNINRINEGDRYMIYENSKRYIDTDKIYNSRKFGLANIPNVSLDKEVKNVKNFEFNVINMKNTQLDLPICIKLTNNQ